THRLSSPLGYVRSIPYPALQPQAGRPIHGLRVYKGLPHRGIQTDAPGKPDREENSSSAATRFYPAKNFRKSACPLPSLTTPYSFEVAPRGNLTAIHYHFPTAYFQTRRRRNGSSGYLLSE